MRLDAHEKLTKDQGQDVQIGHLVVLVRKILLGGCVRHVELSRAVQQLSLKSDF